jgi:hypothetical protein
MIFVLLGTGAFGYLAIRLASLSPTKLPISQFIIGLFLIAGGIAFDGLITLYFSPNLSSEGNIFARAFLDYGYSTPLVIVFGVVFQSLLAIAMVSLWGAFLKHREIIITSMFKGNGQSLADFMKAATGGEKLTWRQYFLPLQISELPDAYYFLWPLAVGFIVFSLFRWRAGLEWLGVFYLNDIASLVILVVIALLMYFLWLCWEYKQKQVD